MEGCMGTAFQNVGISQHEKEEEEKEDHQWQSTALSASNSANAWMWTSVQRLIQRTYYTLWIVNSCTCTFLPQNTILRIKSVTFLPPSRAQKDSDLPLSHSVFTNRACHEEQTAENQFFKIKECEMCVSIKYICLFVRPRRWLTPDL